MASDKIVGQYVFHLEGIMWANSLPGGKFHPTMDIVISDLLPERKPLTDVELPIMTGLVDGQYTYGSWPFGNHKWPPSLPSDLPAGTGHCYVPNVGFYPFTELGTFLFSDDGTVAAFIRWNFAGLLTGEFRPFSGRYELETEEVTQQPGGPHIPITVGSSSQRQDKCEVAADERYASMGLRVPVHRSGETQGGLTDGGRPLAAACGGVRTDDPAVTTALHWAMLLSMTLLGLLAIGPTPHYRVYVFATDAAGQPSDEDKARLEGVREIREALAKKKQFQIIDSREDADIIVEVLDREVQDAGEGGFGGAKVTNLANTIIRLRVSHASGGEGSELKGMGLGGRAVKDAADRIEKWADRDQPTPHKRGKDNPPSTVMTLPVA